MQQLRTKYTEQQHSQLQHTRTQLTEQNQLKLAELEAQYQKELVCCVCTILSFLLFDLWLKCVVCVQASTVAELEQSLLNKHNSE